MDQNLLIGLVVVAVVAAVLYAYAPKIKALLARGGIEMFDGMGTVVAPPNRIKTDAANGTGTDVSADPTVGVVSAEGPHVVPTGAASAGFRSGPRAKRSSEGFADYASIDDSGLGSVPMQPAHKPQGCYPREQLNPMELLPSDPNSQWAQVNPQGAGDIQGKNFLSAGALIGINTIGQSLRNANLQLRAEPPCPQVRVSPWLQSTIEPDLQRRPLE